MSTLQELKDALHAARATAPVPVQQVQQKQQESTEPVDITTTTETPAPAQAQNNATAQVEQATKVAQPTNANAAPVQITAATPVPQEESVPTWQDIVNELTAMDNANEERKAEQKKKQRVATAIAAIGDFATHAMNVWGAHYGNNIPIKGAPLTEGVTAKRKLDLAEHDARLEKLKKLKLDAYKARKEDQNDRLKLRELYLKEAKDNRTAQMDALRLQLDMEKYALDKAKSEDEKKQREKNIELLEARIKATNAGVQQGWAKVGNYKERTRQQGIKAARGKQVGFSDGKGNNLAIYENVWKGSMQQVYDILEQELRAEDEKKNGYQARRRWEERNTAAEKNDFVKQNWHKSEKAREMMKALASLDPATMVSTGLGWGEESQEEQIADEQLDW